MWKPTIRGLLARKVRFVLTAAAVVIGVSFVSATYVLTDTVKRSFDAVSAQAFSGIDLVVQSPQALGEGDPPRISDTTLGTVRAVPGVARAEGFVTGYAQFVGRDGESIGGGGPPTIGTSWIDNDPFHLVDDGVSRAPERAGEVAMDAATANDNGFAVGDHVRVLLDGPARRFTIVGLFGLGDLADLGIFTYAAFDLDTAQRAFDAQGLLDSVYVQREEGVSVATLQARLERTLGAGYDVLTSAEASEQEAADVRDFLSFFTFALLGFAAIGVVVGAFVIFNTFTILVTQRTRELGLLRAMGASGGQVVVSVVLEALAVGVLASLLGLVLGVALGVGLLALLSALGLPLPDTTPVILGRTIVVSLSVGVIVTVVASLLPAFRAARVPPMAAINDITASARVTTRRRILIGSLIVAAGVALLVVGVARSQSVSGVFEQVQVVAIGAFALLVGIVVLLAAVARPIAGAIGRPVRALGVSGVLARENAMRNPRRTAVTAAALVIGLALVGLTATFGASAKASVRHDTGAGLLADYVVKTEGFAGFSPEVAARLDDLSAVDTVVPLEVVPVGVGGDGESGDITSAGAADPRLLSKVVNLDFVSGSAEALAFGESGVLLEDVTADHAGVRVGDLVPLQFARGVSQYEVRGTFRNDNFIGLFGQAIPVIVAPSTVIAGSGDHQDTAVLVTATPGRERAARAQMERALSRDFPNIDVLTRDEYRAQQQEEVDQFLNVLTVILALSLITAALGIVNTLALSVFERTRELGLLRTIGMSRRQLRQMVRWESVVIAVIGAVIGLAIGLVWGWAFARSLRSEGLSVFSVPIGQLAIYVLVAVLVGVVAAIVPAWRASHLDVLEAIAEE